MQPGWSLEHAKTYVVHLRGTLRWRELAGPSSIFWIDMGDGRIGVLEGASVVGENFDWGFDSNSSGSSSG